jgi:hypothetical protein
MENTVLLSIEVKQEGLEVKVKDEAYGNLALVGLLEKIKLELILKDSHPSVDNATVEEPIMSNQSYEA